MNVSSSLRAQADRFILEKIDSVPHLEALLLVWNSRPGKWTAAEIAKRLYIAEDRASRILQDLVRHSLVFSNAPEAADFWCDPSPEQNILLDAVNTIYRCELIRITTMIHEKAPSRVRDFARAFRFKKERD